MILTYTKIVEEKFKNRREFTDNYSVLSLKRSQVIDKKYQELQK